ncbi:response regulator [Sulfitobacter pontiacus]|jgi:two-component SAPR family response regulator|uniref:response regulator n=1 Tax=Sulfitobacter TaxID=60136 RepID=UPI00044C959B|nr:response regulator [Sulfitobacter pontiacus]KAJ29194.1 chemotaxis protein CheY [Sulfitobacter pontiacus 3SOLIMAR09]
MTNQPQNIFIVEDEVVVAFEMTDLLEDIGFNVVGPSIHLEDAKAKARDGDIDIAFLDVNLGRDKTSKPVADILRDRGIPFVFITAYDADQISFLGPDDRVVKKPVSSQKLIETLRRVYPSLETE